MSHTTAPPPHLDTDVIKKDSVPFTHDSAVQVTKFLAGIYGFNVDDALRQLGLHNIPVEKVVKEKKPSATKMKLLAEFEELGLTSIDTSLSIAELRRTLAGFKKDAKAATERTRLLNTATGLIPKMEMLDVSPPTQDELDAMPIEELTAFVADTKDAIKTYKQTKAAEKALADEAKKAAKAEKALADEAKKAAKAAEMAAKTEEKVAKAAEKAAKAEKKAERAAQKKAKIDELIAKIQTHLPDYVAPEDPKIGELNKLLKECSPAQTRPRGRPKKVSAATDDSDEDDTPKEVKPKKKRGRPAKTNKVVESVGNDLIAALVKQAAEASTDEDSAHATYEPPTTDLNKTPTPTPEKPLELEQEEEDEEEEEEETLYEWTYDHQIHLKNTPEDLPGYIYRHTAESTNAAATTLPFAHWTGTLLCLL